jgi:caffeoyl-CoA O-methyltransferase
MNEPKPLSPHAKTKSFWTTEMQERCVELFGPEDEALKRLRQDAKDKGLPDIAVSASDGQLLRLLVASCRARRVVEIGTLGGYSAVWIARGMAPNGSIDSFEIDPARAAFAREHFARAAVDVKFSVHEGPALQNLSKVPGNVDFVFIDADKSNYPRYLAWALDRLAPGGIVALDNAFAWGGLVDPSSLGERSSEADAMIEAMNLLRSDARFVSAMIPTNEGLAVGWRRH